MVGLWNEALPPLLKFRPGVGGSFSLWLAM
jgi:hypothetical protein